MTWSSRRPLPLAAINDSTPEGKQILASAKQILINLGKKDDTAITIEETTDTVKIFAQTNFNGDGILPADAASDDATRAVINEIITCLGAGTGRLLVLATLRAVGGHRIPFRRPS